MPYPNYYSPELIRKAAEAVRNEQQRVGDFQDPARRALFNNAVDQGLFYDAIDDIANEEGLDPSDVDIRNYRDESDFPDYIPYSSNVEVDPDLEDYTGYRLAGQNPKLSELLRDSSNLPDDTPPEFLDQVYEDVNAGRVNPNDLRDIYSSFQSRVLDDANPTSEQWEAANFVERAGTRDRSSALDPSIYEGFTALEEDLDEAKAKEISQSFDNTASCMLGVSEYPLAVVKQEGTEASTDLPITDPPFHYAGELKRLQADCKREMRAVGDRILHLKEVYEDTKDGKYLEALQQDCAKLLPGASAIFKKIEKVHLSLITPSADDEHEAVLLAIAKSLHEFQKDYDELLMWYGRLHPKHAKRTKK